ncbi:MAG: hypothetical protein ACREP1_06730, partial [Rhodanobacteraceae bacterium]
MIAALLLAGALSAMQIFTQAQERWESHAIPPFVTWNTAIVHLDSHGAEVDEHERVILRTADHVCFAQTTNDRTGASRTQAGKTCFGPAGSPLGFSTSSTYRSADAPDPFAPVSGEQPATPLRIIGSVVTIASAYDVVRWADDAIDGANVYHLGLTPKRHPRRYPLRALWVDSSTFDVRKLTYAEWPDGWETQVDYTFAPIGPSQTWW